MSKYIIEINERSKKGKALKMLLESEESIKIQPYNLTQEIPISDSSFKSWEEFNDGFGIGKTNPADLKKIREKAWSRK